jgi:uncharacterized protein (TIGR02300 family)
VAEDRPFLQPASTGSDILVKADLGTKRACPSCGVRFYDLQKRPIECPKCEFSFEPDALYKQRRPRQPEALKGVPAGNLDENEEREDEETEEDAEEEEATVDEAPLLVPTGDDEDEELEADGDEESEDAGMSVVDSDVDVEEIEDVEGQDEGLLEEVEDDEDGDVSGIIEPGVRKGES